MERAIVWNLFRQQMQPAVDQCREMFLERLAKQPADLKQAVLQLMEQAHGAWGEKEQAVYFYFSLLKVDIIDHKYTLALKILDDHWYLDETPVEVYGNIDFLFAEFEELRKHLMSQKKRYVGKIDQYDIEILLFEELQSYSSTIAHYLRYLLRNIEAEPAFACFPTDDYWVIRWGEYESDTEVVIQKDLQPKDEVEWQRNIEKTIEAPYCMAGGYWYQLVLKQTECANKDMLFICFDRCTLKEVVFDNCNLVGSRFLESVIEQCTFIGADLRDADFSNCQMDQVDFTDADITGAIFSAAAIPGLGLTEEQLNSIYVKED